ncbi:hypothetical protein ScPMuIL_000725 [Solemya velum]
MIIHKLCCLPNLFKTNSFFLTNLGHNLIRRRSTMVASEIKCVYDESAVIKSAEDKRHYRGLQLNNGMTVMLISDPDTDKSSASMDINIGHMKDPWEIPGLAHFCEHMLFLGTKKYPEENEYTKFLNENGGSSNAFTSAEHTNFYFDISPDCLLGALDRFAQFFLAPLFTESASEREVNAVHSENEKNLQSDPWRIHQLARALSDPKHDFSKFGTGNNETLGTKPKELGLDVREELLKFHSNFYSSNLMGLCVLGKESLDEMTEMILPLFAGVENKNVAVPEWNDNPYRDTEVGTLCQVVPVKDIRNLAVTWSIPDLQPYYKSNPGHYLGHLIGHEGQGSLLSELKNRGWVNTLIGGQKHGAKGFMFFVVNVDLSEDGLEHVDDIVTLMYQYINMLREKGIQDWIFKECQDLSAMTFRFKDKEKPRGYTTHVSAALHEYPIPEVLSGAYLLSEFRPDLINMVLERLTPENMRIAVVAKKFEGRTDQKEKWYGTDYKLEKIPEDKMQLWRNCGVHENLKLPGENEFIPTNFDLVPKMATENSFPEMIKDTALIRLWFKQDNKFFLPKACVNFELTSPQAYIDPIHHNMTTLFVALFKDALNEYSYDADLAGLHYNLDSTIYGIHLSLKGYNDKLGVLLKKIMQKLTSFQVDPKRYEILKELFTRSLRNFNAEQPHQHAMYYTSVLMSEIMWTKDEMLEAMEDVTLENLQNFIPKLLYKLHMEGLIYGNISEQKALELSDIVENVLSSQSGTKPLLASQHKRYRELQLPNGCYFVCQMTNEVHSSSSIEIYYQCGMQETMGNVLLELFCQIIGEPCFNILRTQEQLGYIVFSGIRRASGVQGLRVIVQSDRSPEYVEKRVEAFLLSMDKYISDMTEEEFQKHNAALATRRMEQPKKMSAQHLKYWGEIISEQYNFDRDNIEVVTLKSVTKEDLYKFYKVSKV